MQAFRNAMQGIEDEAEKSRTGLKAFGNATNEAAKNITKGLGSFALNVGKGDTSFKSLNTVIDITSNALAGMAKAIPFAGEAAAAALKATAEAAKFMMDQMDQTTQAFNDLGKVGALTASGMSGLQQQFLTSGLSLKTFTKQVADNSVALARFRGMTGDGAEEFARVAQEFTQGNDDSLRRLGMSSDMIGETVAGFVTQQTRLGRAQTMSTKELQDGTKAYAMQLDELSKLTGQSTESLRKQQDAALSESRFRASIASLNKEQQDALMGLQSVMHSFGAEMGQGTRDLVSGAANTEAARKLMVDTGGAAQDIINRLKSGQIDQAQAQLEMQAAVQRNLKAGENYSKFQDGASGVMGNFASKMDIATARFDKYGNVIQDTQKKQVAGTDGLTKDTVAAQKAMEGVNREMQRLGFTFLPNASAAVRSFATTMQKLVGYINEKVLGQPEGSGGGGGQAGVSGEFGGDQTGAGAGPAQLTPDEMGLKGLPIKKGATSGGEHTDVLTGLAQRIHKELGGDLVHFSGFNDGYSRDKNSKHPRGQALDFTIKDASQSARIAGLVRGMPGVSYVQDEYLNPSPRSSGNHIHAEVSAANGAVLSGPMSGYKPNLTMHGTEAVVPLNTAAQQAAGGMMDPGIMQAQLERLDELVSVMKNQLNVSTKIMQYSH